MARKLGPKLTDEQKAKIAKLRKGRKSAPAIAKALKVNEHQVYYFLHNKKGKKQDAKQVTGMTSQAIQAELSVALQRASELKKLLKSALKDEQKFLKLKA